MRRDEVYGQLGKVYDPELDQPLTELGFIGGVSIDGNTVAVHFRLPTFWCAANFAFMMAADIRERVSELPWVERVDVQLQDHFFDQEPQFSTAVAEAMACFIARYAPVQAAVTTA